MASPAPIAIALLDDTHDVSAFDCGQPELNDWLRRFALVNQRSDSVRAYVAHRDGRVVGYYALTTGSADRSTVPTRIGRGLPNHPVPLIVLARFAVDRDEQGQGLGAALLKDALLQVVRAADTIGVRALVVHAKDDEARRFYEHFDFDPSPTDPLHLFLLLKDIRAILGES